jgi:hypothetical protein
MARPSNLPEWASGGSAAIVEPLAGKKLIGYVSGEHPPAEIDNWLLHLIYLWISWFVTRADQPTTVAPDVGHAVSAGWAITSTGEITGSTNAASWAVPVQARVGDTIASVSARVKPGGATNTVTVAIATIKDGVATAISGGVASTAGAAYETVTDVDPLAGHVIAAGECVVLTFTASGGGAGARKASTATVAFTTP